VIVMVSVEKTVEVVQGAAEVIVALVGKGIELVADGNPETEVAGPDGSPETEIAVPDGSPETDVAVLDGSVGGDDG
jgi:hypothetical protein